ncbi:MAG TPA: efflux RND transporter periplasmic adaptor subunit [Anaeromyxobacteraceae bacterium]|nr:efflux RND transporter periplasmic adaptor subunit [Anaeromyxobacteraceae bacterium]
MLTIRSPRGLRAAACLSLCLAAAACQRGPKGPRVRPAPVVAAAAVSVRDVPVEVRAAVDLRPLFAADVGSKVVGYLDAVLVDRGDRVRRGQLLALVRPSDLPDQLAAARHQLAQAQASAALARANKERAERLAPSGVVSQQELQQNEAALANAEAALQAGQANVGVLATRLGETRIESPLDGAVSARRLDPGALVGPTSGTGAVLTVERDDVLRAFVPVNESEAGLVRVGQDVRLTLDAFPGREFTGKVVRLAPGLDPLTRTLDAEVQLKNPGELRSGMYGRCAIVTAVHPNAVVVPAVAVQISDERQYVYVLQGEKVKRTEVRTGIDGGTWLEVISGLARSDVVVIAGIDGLADGATVQAQRDVDPYTGQKTVSAAEGR